MYKTFFKAGALAFFLGGGLPSYAENWTAVTLNPSAKTVSVPFFKEMFREIEEKTGGALSIDLKLSSQLPFATSTYTQVVGDGVVQIADDGYAAGNVPIVGLLKLPMLIQTSEEAAKAAELAMPAISAAYEEKGALALGIYFFPAQMAFGRGEITGLSDLEGLKLETDSPQQEHFVKSFGGLGVVVSPAEVPSALQRGTLDAVITASAGGAKIWSDMLASNYRLPITQFPVVFAVNKSAFEALPSEDQQVVRSVISSRISDLTEIFLEDEDRVTEKLIEDGMNVTLPTQDEIDQATSMMRPYWDEWAATQGEAAQNLLKEIRAELGK